jgi:hypothetical protein
MMEPYLADWLDILTTPMPTLFGPNESFIKRLYTTKGNPDKKVQAQLEKQFRFSYRRAIGQLIWPMTTCRPDLCQSVVKLAHFSAKGESITHYYFSLSPSKSTIQNALVHFLRNLHNLSHPNQLCLFPLLVAIAAKQCLIPLSPISADTAATANRLGAPTPKTNTTMLPSPACTAATRSKPSRSTNPKNARKTPLASPSQSIAFLHRNVRQPIHPSLSRPTSTINLLSLHNKNGEQCYTSTHVIP